MPIRGFFYAILWLLKEARHFSPMRAYRGLRDWKSRPRLFDIQFKTQRNTPQKYHAYIDEGALDVPFSALDNHGIIKSSQLGAKSEARRTQETTPPVKEKIRLNYAPPLTSSVAAEAAASKEKEPAPPVDLHAAMMREAVASTEKLDPAFPNLDCVDLHYRFSIVGIRNSHMHLLARNALGKTFKTTVHNVFDQQGRLQVKGLQVRLPLPQKEKAEAETVYHSAGTIDLTGYVGLTAHTLAQLEDAINDGIKQLRRAETEPVAVPKPRPEVKAPLSTLSVLQSIRAVLKKSEPEERRNYADRRAGDDRRLLERRDEPERRSGVDRRKSKEEKLKNFMLVKDEEYRKKDRRLQERRSGTERRRGGTERRESTERRTELHIPVRRSQYIRGERNSIIAVVSDSWTIGQKEEGEEIILNPRDDFTSTQLFIDSVGGRIAVQGEVGARHETFILPHMGMPTLIRTNTDVTVHLAPRGKGLLYFKPLRKTRADVILRMPASMLAAATVELADKGRRTMLFGLLTVEVSRLHKSAVIQTLEGHNYPLNSADDIKLLNEIIRALARGGVGNAGA
jgi:hypothetical protein